jgi:mono/diheme cytochrome c family protein
MRCLFFFLVTVSLVACGKAEFVDPPPVSNVDFASAEAIFKANCTVCHSPENGNVAGVDLASYDAILPRLQDIQVQVSSDNMPMGGPPLSEAEKATLFAWIKMGAPKVAEPDKL